MNHYDVDCFVIGAGSGGVRAARIAAGHGARVMIAEADRVGGTCVIRGCVPKKLMVLAGRFADDFADARGFGWNLGSPRHDWTALIRSGEHTSELQSLMRISYAVFCLKKKNPNHACSLLLHTD